MNIDSVGLDSPYALPKIFISIGLVIFILVVAKIGLVLNLSIWLILPALIVAFIFFCFISPPAAVALFLTSHYLIGQISIARPGFSVLSILSGVLVVVLIFVRWRERTLVKVIRMRRAQFVSFLLLMGFMAIGFIRAVQSPYAVWLGFSSDYSLLAMFEGSARNTNSLLHYVFLSHWLVFIAMGVLACVTPTELKTFFVAFSLFYLIELLALPIQFYLEFFQKIYVECQAMALSLGNVNRAHMGYLAAMTSTISLAQAHHQGERFRNLFYLVSSLAVVILFLAGSKGPVLAWVIGTCFVMLFADQKQWVRSLAVVGAITSVVGISALMDHSLVPCGMIKQYTESSHSYAARANLVREAIGTSAHSDLLHVLVGGGFGASTRSVNDTGQILTHSGSLNLFFDLLLETGVVGLVFFLLALVILVVTFAKALLRQDLSDRKPHMAAMGSVLMIVLVKLMVATETHTEDLGALIIGLLMGSAVYAPAAISATSDVNIAAIAAGPADKLRCSDR